MIAPLYVVVPVIHQQVKNEVCSRSAVIDIAEDMQLVDAERLDYAAYRLDERIGLTGGDDRLHDTVVV